MQPAETTNFLQLIVPPKVESQFLFVSPCVPDKKIPFLFARLSSLGVSILDVQKIQFSDFDVYQKEALRGLKVEHFRTLRGRTFINQVGYVLKLSGENLS